MKDQLFEILHNRKRMPGERLSDVEGKIELLIATEVERRIQERTVKEDVLIERLAQFYYHGDYNNRAQIAEICDEVLDPSGKLLGKVRDESDSIRSRLTENKQEGGEG